MSTSRLFGRGRSTHRSVGPSQVQGPSDHAAKPSRVLRRAGWASASALSQAVLGSGRGVETLEGRTYFSVSTDAQGWTVVTPSTDSRIVYVSADGSDTNNGLSPAAPVATFAYARTLVRSGFPDWILLRRGDTFNGQRFGTFTHSGRNADEPFVLGAYTDPNAPSTARPQINTGVQTGVSFGGSSPSRHVYIMGLAFEAHRRDYRDPPTNFTSDWLTDAQGGTYGVNGSVPVHDVHIEDSSFQYYKGALVFQNNASDITVRRSIIADSWCVNVDQFGKPMGFDTATNGIYADQVNGLAIDGNVLSHNGWADLNSLFSRQNLYSHNLYLNTGNSNVSVTNNVIADGASHGLQMRAGGIVKGNTFLRNPIAMSFGLVNGAVKAGGVSGEISDNVIVGSSAIFDSARGWGIEIANLKSLANGGGTVIRNNVFANDNQNNAPAIKLDQPQTSVPDVGINDLLIEKNVVYSWFKGISIHPSYDVSRPLSGLVVRQNDFQRINLGATIADISGPFVASHQSWSNNRYDSLSTDPNVVLFKIAGVNKTLAQWQAQVEPTAIRALGLFPDPGRTAGGYNASLGGQNSTDEFIRQAMRQSRSFWRPAYTTDPVNDWIRAGYAGGRIDLAAPTASASADNITVAGGGTQTFTVTLSDDNRIDLSSIGDGDLRVTGPGGYTAVASLVSSSGPADGSRRTVTYRVNAPAGGWTAAANGVYTIAVQDGQIADASGRTAAADPVGSFSVTIDPAVPAAVATAPAIVTDSAAATVSVTYTGAVTPGLPTSVSPANAGFETPNVAGEPGAFAYLPAGGSWNFAGDSGIAANFSGFTWTNTEAPQGGQVAFLQKNGAFSQTVSDWLAGTYTLSFVAAQRNDVGIRQHDFQVLVDGQVVGTFQPQDTSYRTYTTAPFTVAAGAHTVEFRGLNSVGGDETSFIDDVRIVGTTAPVQQQLAVNSFDTADIRLTGANGFAATPTSIAVDDTVDGNQRTVTYTFAAPAGGWLTGGRSLAINVAGQQVTTTSGAVVPASKVGTVAVGVNAPIVASVLAPSVTASSTASQTLVVRYTDNNPGAALIASIDNSDLRVTGPSGYNQAATLVSVSGDGTTGSPVIATYTIPAPAGGWSPVVNGTYWIVAQANQVVDADGNALAAGAIDSFRVAVDATPPLAMAIEDDITKPTTGSKSIGVSYSDANGIDGSSVDSADIRILGPNGFDAAVTRSFFVNDATAAYAEYVLAAPGGKWQSRHNGTYSIVLQPSQVLDGAGNAATTATTIATFQVNIEVVPPTGSVVSVTPNPRNTALSSVAVNFSELVTGLDVSDFVLTRDGTPVSLSAATLTSANGINYTLGNLATATSSAGNYSLQLAAGPSGVIDDAGNPLSGNLSTSWTTDLTPPQASATAGSISSPTSGPLSITVNYTDNFGINPTTLNASDLRVTGPGGFDSAVALTSVSGTGNNRTAVYSLAAPAGGWTSARNGTYSINLSSGEVLDLAGNVVSSGAIGSFQVTLETTPPTISIAAISPSPRSTPVSSVTIAASEAITGFDLADVSLTRDGNVVSLAGATLTSSDGVNFTLGNLGPSTSAAGSYVLTVRGSGSGITDGVGNALAQGATASWSVDTSAPQATASAGNVTAPGTGSVSLNVTYTDNGGLNGSTIDNSDITVTGPNGFSQSATVVSVTGTGGTRSVVYSINAPSGGWKSSNNGTYSIVLYGGQVADNLGNTATGGTIGSFNVSIETTAPTATFAPVTTPRTDAVASIGLTFSEDVTGFDVSDLSLMCDNQPTSLAGVVISGSGGAYTIDGLAVATGAPGVYRLMLASPAGIADTAGNPLATGTSVTFEITDTVAIRPDLGFESPAVGFGQFQYRPTGSAWTFSSDAGISANSSGFTVGSPDAPQGGQLAFLQKTGAIAQNIDSWSAGTYTLSFSAAQRANIGPQQHDFRVLIDGQSIGTFTPSSTSFGTYQTAPFTVGAGSHKVEFVGINSLGGDHTSFIDDVQISGFVAPVPVVSAVGSGPVFGSVFAQQLTIQGSNFTDDASVVLRDQAGQAIGGVSVVSRSSSAIVVNARLGEAGGTYSAEVVGTTGSSQPFAFDVAAQPAVTVGGTVANTGKTASLTVGGVVGNGVSYTWSVIGGPAGATIAGNGTAATAQFTAIGDYTIQVVASDGTSSLTQTATLSVAQVLTDLAVTPATATVGTGATQQLTATGVDQFGGSMATGGVSWSITAGTGTVSSTGLFTASSAAGNTTVQASVGSIARTASMTVQASSTTAVVASVDFSPASSAVQSGYVGDTGALYGARGNGLTYGWSTSHTDAVFDRNVNLNQLVDTTLLMKKPAKWELAVANGTYTVTVGVGDAAAASTANIWVEGVQLYNYVPVAANAFQTRTLTVTVSDGRLTIGNGSANDQQTRITHVQVTRPATSPPTSPPPTSPPPTSPPSPTSPPPTSPPVVTGTRINFQPSAAPTVSGYLVDGGQTYGNRGNGQTYGWSVSHTDSMIDRNVNTDQRYDTLIAVKKSSKWNMAVANGRYTVTVVAGDAAAASTNNVWVEGNWSMNYVSAAANTYVTRTLTVNVTDGTLTLEFGGTADKATKLNFIEITPAP